MLTTDFPVSVTAKERLKLECEEKWQCFAGGNSTKREESLGDGLGMTVSQI